MMRAPRDSLEGFIENMFSSLSVSAKKKKLNNVDSVTIYCTFL